MKQFFTQPGREKSRSDRRTAEGESDNTSSGYALYKPLTKNGKNFTEGTRITGRNGEELVLNNEGYIRQINKQKYDSDKKLVKSSQEHIKSIMNDILDSGNDLFMINYYGDELYNLLKRGESLSINQLISYGYNGTIAASIVPSHRNIDARPSVISVLEVGREARAQALSKLFLTLSVYLRNTEFIGQQINTETPDFMIQSDALDFSSGVGGIVGSAATE